jgi:hypothetical protein
LVGQVKHENRLDKIDQYVSVIYQQLPSLRKGEK